MGGHSYMPVVPIDWGEQVKRHIAVPTPENLHARAKAREQKTEEPKETYGKLPDPYDKLDEY